MTENSCPQPLGASRSIYYSLTDEVPGLTDEEKDKLEAVMKKALEFEAEEANRMSICLIFEQPVEGILYKYTNVVKGWQYRWFILTPDSGMLEYYMVEEKKKSKPRGGMHLAGATITLSDEDSLSFIVSAVYGEIYKLKASDAKERQFWVERMRYVIEKFANHSVEKNGQQTSNQDPFALCKVSPAGSSAEEKLQATPKTIPNQLNITEVSTSSDISINSLIEISESVTKALECQRILAKSIEDLPLSGSSVKCSDSKLLLVKAISQASVQSLEQCYIILRRRKQAYTPSPIREIKSTPYNSSWKLI
ncbi:oxysterol-binding protein-related protein 11 isoform X2 [Parasteatoda tepidariorum]|uniref:oxysterol-binding protein-related protein 11 isoform X2 n=1 Tax=Parasteatoda tepidariorum TaxID=114398 RepID=UPI0039BC59F0